MIQQLRILCLAAIFTVSVSSALAAEKEKRQVDTSKLPPASDKKDVTYAADIQPLFEKSCVKCHGPEKPKGRLRLDSLQGVLKGGEDGKVVKPGDSAGSMLIHNVAHIGDPDDYMPPPRNKAGIQPLTAEQIGLLRAWIDQGAK
jgi:mono/diheme cytochrome c family protein